MLEIKYKYSSFTRTIEGESKIPIYEINDLFLYKNESKKTIVLDDFYFIIKTGVNYAHALCDGIGAYYQFKKIYPNLKPIFIKEKSKIIKDAEYFGPPLIDFAHSNNFEVIDLKDNNFLFKKALLHHYIFSLIPPIELEKTFLFNEDNIDIQKIFYANSIKEILNNIKIDNENPNNKIYVSRKKANINRKLSDNKYWAKETSYDTSLDDKIEKIFMNNGFKIIELESYGLYDQIKLFENCKILINIDGTSNINGIWMNSQSKIIRIKLFDSGFDWNNILAASGKKYIYEYNLNKNNHEEVFCGINKIIKDLS